MAIILGEAGSSVEVEGDYWALFVGGTRDGREIDLNDGAEPSAATNAETTDHEYWSVGSVERGGRQVFVFVCDETNIADLRRREVVEDIFIGRFQGVRLLPAPSGGPHQ